MTQFLFLELMPRNERGLKGREVWGESDNEGRGGGEGERETLCLFLPPHVSLNSIVSDLRRNVNHNDKTCW